MPVAVHASIHGVRLRLRALVLSPSGSERIEGSAEGALESPEMLGITLGSELLQRGAGRLLEASG
jgi:porphobilinogen deaminase